MYIGLLKETLPGERRVALTPAAVRRLTDAGQRVVVEHRAGERSHFPDEAYTAAGAQLAFSAGEVIQRSELLVKVERPTRAENAQLVPQQTVLAFYHLAVAAREELDRMLEGAVTAVGFELIRTAEGRAPVLEPMSEIGGQMALAVAGHLLRSSSGGRGILLGGAPGIPPARVLILGAGVVGTWAARAAVANGATTIVLDSNPEQLRKLLATVPRAITGIADVDTIRDTVRDVDVLIGAVLMPGERTPTLVTRAMVESMPRGSVIVDVSIDQGGCVETMRPTTIHDPVFVHSGVVHYGVPNMTADIARTASLALSQASLPYILEIAHHGVDRALEERDDLARGVYTYGGHVVSEALAGRWQLPSRDISELLQASKETVAL